jgi:hypothetical protein
LEFLQLRCGKSLEKWPDFEAAVIFKTASRGDLGDSCFATWIAQFLGRKSRRVEWPGKNVHRRDGPFQ